MFIVQLFKNSTLFLGALKRPQVKTNLRQNWFYYSWVTVSFLLLNMSHDIQKAFLLDKLIATMIFTLKNILHRIHETFFSFFTKQTSAHYTLWEIYTPQGNYKYRSDGGHLRNTYTVLYSRKIFRYSRKSPPVDGSWIFHYCCDCNDCYDCYLR